MLNCRENRLVAQEGSSIVTGIVTIPTTGGPSFMVNTATGFTLGTTPPASGGGWIDTNLFEIDGTTTVVASAFDFQAGTELHFENSTINAASGSGPILSLRPTVLGVDVGMHSDIYITRPSAFYEDGFGTVILAEVLNDGTFNGNDASNPTTGDFYVWDGTQYIPGEKAPFQRSATPGAYEGLSLTPNADNTGSWLIYAMADQNANSTDLTWTGTDADTGTPVNTWESITTTNTSATAATNWFGTVQGIPVNQFLNGDTVLFDDTAVNKNVELSEAVRVGSMTVAGTNYVFALNNNSGIAAVISERRRSRSASERPVRRVRRSAPAPSCWAREACLSSLQTAFPVTTNFWMPS